MGLAYLAVTVSMVFSPALRQMDTVPDPIPAPRMPPTTPGLPWIWPSDNNFRLTSPEGIR